LSFEVRFQKILAKYNTSIRKKYYLFCHARYLDQSIPQYHSTIPHDLFFKYKFSCPPVAIVTELKCKDWNETLDLSSENIELADPELLESLPDLELMKTLTRSKSLRLSSAAVGLPHLNTLFGILVENSCKLQDLGE
jgi:hypothetical protein